MRLDSVHLSLVPKPADTALGVGAALCPHRQLQRTIESLRHTTPIRN